jgi:hypothetical protein
MKKTHIYVLLWWLVVSLGARAESWREAPEYPLVTYSVQAGIDIWRFSPRLPDMNLNMANNSQSAFRPESPWAVLDGRLAISKNLVLSLKARADQGMGQHVDELSADWAYSPSFGFKAGVVSYKTSWCRIYDVDSPWVRENDPFCSSAIANESSGGAPGMQAYVNLRREPYRVQAIVGTYRPLLFNYNSKEFSNLRYANSQVNGNDKQGASLSLLHELTATELRIGVLGAKQSARVKADGRDEIDHVNQDSGIVFAGLSFYAAPKLNVRMQTLRHETTSHRWTPLYSTYPHYLSGLEALRQSDVLELNYQHGINDVLALAVSRYSYNSTSIQTKYPEVGYAGSVGFPYLLRSLSASWRHDWEGGVYTAIQWTYSQVRAEAFQEPNSSSFAYRNAHGLGLRLAYRF